MKFKCGLTKEEEEAKTKKLYDEAMDIIRNGEIVFAWWPTRVKKGDCRWLERVKRTPTRIRETGYYTSWESVNSYTDHRCATLYSEGQPFIMWKYEAL